MWERPDDGAREATDVGFGIKFLKHVYSSTLLQPTLSPTPCLLGADSRVRIVFRHIRKRGVLVMSCEQKVFVVAFRELHYLRKTAAEFAHRAQTGR